MKRLIKISEHFDTLMIRGNDVKIFKNPTQDDINEVRHENSYNAIRGIINIDGTIYIWDGSFLHDDVYSRKINTDNGFHFSYEKSRWNFDVCNTSITIKEVYEFLNQYKDHLSQIGSLSNKILIGQTIDKFGNIENFNKKGFFQFNNWNEMNEYVKNLK